MTWTEAIKACSGWGYRRQQDGTGGTYLELLLFLTRYRLFFFLGLFGAMEDYWNHTRCYNDHCGIDFHDHTHQREEVVRNASGIYSTMLLTQRAIDIVSHHDQNKVTKFYKSRLQNLFMCYICSIFCWNLLSALVPVFSIAISSFSSSSSTIIYQQT